MEVWIRKFFLTTLFGDVRHRKIRSAILPRFALISGPLLCVELVPVLNNENSMNYPDFQQQLSRLHVDSDVPEVHGQLCGLLCTCKAEKAKVHWFSTVLENLKSQPGLLSENAEQSRAALQELDEMFTSTREQLNSEDFAFELFLDPSPHVVVDRMTDLAAWCNGFVYGFGIGVGEQKATLPEDTAELIEDFQTIAAYEVSDEEADDGVGSAPANGFARQLSANENPSPNDDSVDQDESDITEIEEFIRVGVLLIAEEMQAVLRGNDTDKKAPAGAVQAGHDEDSGMDMGSNMASDGSAPTLH